MIAEWGDIDRIPENQNHHIIMSHAQITSI